MLCAMKHHRTALVAVAALAALAALPPRAGAQDKKGTPACVRFWGQTVAAYPGYNHVVGIENSCDKPVDCVVSTNVAPDPIHATVAAKDKTELITFRGSPTYQFTPKVECKYP
jgi:hypothetical protein